MGLLDGPLRDASKVVHDVLGADATLVDPEVTYNSATDEEIDGADTTEAVKITPPQAFSSGEIDGTLVEVNDLRCSIAAKGLTDTPNPDKHLLRFGGVDYKIIRVSPLYSGDQVAQYDLQLRA